MDALVVTSQENHTNEISEAVEATETPAITPQTPAAQSLKAYCVFCRTGAEQVAIRSIRQNFPDLIAFAPLKALPEKRQGEWTTREKVLLPGYIFLFAPGELPFDLKRKSNHVYKVLQYERGIRALSGPDAEYAEWLLRHAGVIQPSRVVLQPGQTIQVIDGPLLDFQGKIVQLDHHKRRAWVEFDFDGQKKVISIGVEVIMGDEREQTR
jgi:transcription termination/antitermination protein NusG